MRAARAHILDGLISSPAQLQRMLGGITEHLAAELGRPTASRPSWSDTEWIIAKAVVAMHGVAPLFATRLQWSGPAHWNRFLDEQRDHTQRRHQRILDTVAQLDGLLRGEAIAATALKGVALHEIGMYRAGERPMADVDILVRPADAVRTVRVLETMGFYESAHCWKEREFSPREASAQSSFGEHAQNNVKIELHERISERLPARLTDISDQIFASNPQPGFNAYPSLGALLAHLVFHAAGAMAYQTVRLLHLNDLAAVCARMTNSDWEAFLAPRRHGTRLWWAWPPLRLMARYFDVRIPGPVVDALVRDCPWVLERSTRGMMLTDVSFSHLWIDAFPGIEWSQSPGEVLEFLLQRVRPSAEQMEVRKRTAALQRWAADNEWVARSQMRRILRWVTSRQLRPPAEHSLRAVLGRPK